jgi:hypothetical protein
MKKTFNITPKKVADNPYLLISYKSLISAARKGKSMKSVNADIGLKETLIRLTYSELSKYDLKVIEALQDIENRIEIGRLRKKIAGYSQRIAELKEKSGEDDNTPKALKLKF